MLLFLDSASSSHTSFGQLTPLQSHPSWLPQTCNTHHTAALDASQHVLHLRLWKSMCLPHPNSQRRVATPAPHASGEGLFRAPNKTWCWVRCLRAFMVGLFYSSLKQNAGGLKAESDREGEFWASRFRAGDATSSSDRDMAWRRQTGTSISKELHWSCGLLKKEQAPVQKRCTLPRQPPQRASLISLLVCSETER